MALSVLPAELSKNKPADFHTTWWLLEFDPIKNQKFFFFFVLLTLALAAVRSLQGALLVLALSSSPPDEEYLTFNFYLVSI